MRLIKFAAFVIDISEGLPKTFAGNHIAGQLVRSGTSPALNYGEAQSAESRNDFIHKMKISAKELRETYNCLRIIQTKNWYDAAKLEIALNETTNLSPSLLKVLKQLRKTM